ncbi:hypothetical protein [Carboxylicivirga marina]|uniref:SPOR domain-containing protein n=1 Tax=Carboxylicivirga marina TaxID=2800988 RepID=A0ABS1HHV3_9BACT|nr:hypothetical protein [Carboxylicivirga marina]MBK3517251.1 hypothetical protein [Carboxylicivirga marina]
MSLPENTMPEHKLQLRVEALNNELTRLRKSSKKQTVKISNLRLWFYFTLVFSVTLFSFLIIQGFISLPNNQPTAQFTPLIDTVYIEKAIDIDSLEKITYNTHKSALPKEDYDGVLFAIQIGAYKDLDLSDYKNNMLGLKQDTYDSINQFTLGEFIQYEEATKFLSIVQHMGFEQAHIMSFRNGYRIRLENALALRQKIKSTNKVADKGFLEANDERFDLLAQ